MTPTASRIMGRKAIIERQNDRGSWDGVGMNNRTVIGPYKRASTFWTKAHEYAGGRSFTIEIYPGRPAALLMDDPQEVIHWCRTCGTKRYVWEHCHEQGVFKDPCPEEHCPHRRPKA